MTTAEGIAEAFDSPAGRSTDDFRTVVTRLRAERKMSLEDLAFEARRNAPEKGAVSLSLIQKRLAPGSTSPPSIELMEAVAAALEIEPETFVEYRLAKTRALFDERALPVMEALDNAMDALRRPDITVYDADRNVLLVVEAKALSQSVSEDDLIERLAEHMAPLAESLGAAYIGVSHPDGDHIRGIAELLTRDPAERFVDLARQAGPTPRPPREQRPAGDQTAGESRSESGG